VISVGIGIFHQKYFLLFNLLLISFRLLNLKRRKETMASGSGKGGLGAGMAGNRATIAVVPSLRRSMSESDLHGVAELIKSVVVPSSSVSCSLRTFKRKTYLEGLEQRLRLREVGIWDQLSSIKARLKRIMRGSRREGIRQWLTSLRFSVEEEDESGSRDMEECFGLLSGGQAGRGGRFSVTSEELMRKISPEAASLLREILSGSSWEELELRSRNQEALEARRKCSCCEGERGEGEEGSKAIQEHRKGSSTGVLAHWAHFIHWAECDKVIEEERDEEMNVVGESGLPPSDERDAEEGEVNRLSYFINFSPFVIVFELFQLFLGLV